MSSSLTPHDPQSSNDEPEKELNDLEEEMEFGIQGVLGERIEPNGKESFVRKGKRFVWKTFFSMMNSRFEKSTKIVFDDEVELSSHSYYQTTDQSDKSYYELDILKPKKVSSKHTIAFFHGGGFVVGEKSWYQEALSRMVCKGYTVININYPLAPKYTFIKILEAALIALQWIKKSPLLNDNEITLMGDSAGGAIVSVSALVILNPQLQEFMFSKQLEKDLFPSISSVVDLYGVNDRRILCEKWWYGKKLLGEAVPKDKKPFDFDNITPSNAVTPVDLLTVGENLTLCPILIVCGAKDVILDSSIHLHETLKEKNFQSNLKIYEGQNHGFFSFYWKKESHQLCDDIEEFIDQNSSKQD